MTDSTHDPLTAAIIRAGERLDTQHGWTVRDDEVTGAPGPDDLFVRVMREELAPLLDLKHALRLRRDALVSAIRRNQNERDALVSELEVLAVDEQRSASETP